MDVLLICHVELSPGLYSLAPFPCQHRPCEHTCEPWLLGGPHVAKDLNSEGKRKKGTVGELQ